MTDVHPQPVHVQHGAHAFAPASPGGDDYAGEVALLRASLAHLAGQLEAEKQRVSALEAQRRADEEKVTTLRSMVEESRRALMRLQLEANKRSSNEASPASRRGSIDVDYSFPPRRGSLLGTDRNLPRRRSSLGLGAISGSPVESPSTPVDEQPPALAGLGFGLESRADTPNSLLRAATPNSLARYAHRRGSASIAVAPQDDDDAQRLGRLRELRLGVHSTKIASRRSSAVSGLPDFVQAGEFERDLERRFGRRLSTVSFSGQGRSGGGGDGAASDGESPISANLNLLGRKQSLTVFEAWSRRSSTAESCGAWSSSGSDSHDATDEQLVDLRLQLEGLKIQLVEAEEGRRASEACLAALRAYVTSSDSRGDTGHGLGMSLPPLPTDEAVDALGDATPSTAYCASAAAAPAPRRSSRWSIPRLSFSLPSREAGTPCTMSRKESTASNASGSTLFDPANRTSSTTTGTPSLPSFGAFSFSTLVSRSATTVSAETSPRMQCGQSPPADSFPVDPSPLMRSHSSSSVSTRNGGAGGGSHSHSASLDDAASLAESVAPSLVSDRDSVSAWSASSSRSTSPSPKLRHLGLVSLGGGDHAHAHDGVGARPQVDLAAEEASAHPFALSDSFGLGLSSPDASCTGHDAVVEAARMPMVKGSLVALSSAVRQRA
ncbi:hypothetical protein JCM9279_007580 [Rhodotorula babjevae]